MHSQSSVASISPAISQGNNSFYKLSRIPIIIALTALAISIIVIAFITSSYSPYQDSASSSDWNKSNHLQNQTVENQYHPITIVGNGTDPSNRTEIPSFSSKQAVLMTSLNNFQLAFDLLANSINEMSVSSLIRAFTEFRRCWETSISTSYIDDQFRLIQAAIIELLRPAHDELIKLKERARKLPPPGENIGSWERFNKHFRRCADSGVVQFMKPVIAIIQGPNPYKLWALIDEICIIYREQITPTHSVEFLQECISKQVAM